MLNPTISNGLKAACTATLLSIAVSNTPASAASLYYFKGPTKAPNERVCLNFAGDQASRHNLQNIKKDNLGVAGTRGDLYAAMTCVGTVVVVMVTGDGAANGSPLAQELFDAVRGEICMDACN